MSHTHVYIAWENLLYFHLHCIKEMAEKSKVKKSEIFILIAVSIVRFIADCIFLKHVQ